MSNNEKSHTNNPTIVSSIGFPCLTTKFVINMTLLSVQTKISSELYLLLSMRKYTAVFFVAQGQFN